jgi:hypothetical protein
VSNEWIIPHPYWLACSVVNSKAEINASQVEAILSSNSVIFVVVLDSVLMFSMVFLQKKINNLCNSIIAQNKKNQKK